MTASSPQHSSFSSSAAASQSSAGNQSSAADSSTGLPVAGAGSAVSAGRLLIVANRLPVSMSIKQTAGGKSDINFASSAGGLVSALAGSGLESYWIGWPGGEVKSREDRSVVVDKLKALKSIPVFLNAEVCDLFYNGFCNDLLWPLFHYIPLPISAIKQHDKQFAAYQQANAEFAKVVLDEYEDGDVVWVHDYHLMLLPSLLRQARPGMKIGFFFHTPFPSSEIYRVIPSRDELLYGVLSANLLGFHTHDYSRHFQSAATRIIGALCSNEQITLNGALSQLGTFPIGIDPTRFLDALATPAVQKHMDELKAQFAGKRVLLGIDRLDYIKGIPQKLHALELFFDRNPQFVGEVVLVQIAIPSRTDVEEYKKLKSSMHELVGRINGRFGSLASVPIHYLDQTIPFDRMCALYRVADCLVVTSIRDGMNLVAYEYIACQNERNGVLILSEFAGAAQSLGAGALQVNPWNISEVADAIHKALTMDEKERRERTEYQFQHVMSHTAEAWAKEFVGVLEGIHVEGEAPSQQQLLNGGASTSSLASLGSGAGETNNQMKAQMPTPLDVDALLSSFAHSKHRLIITGLAGIVSRAAAATVNKETGKGSKAGADIRSDYEEHAGELWGWQEPSTATPAQSAAAPASSDASKAAAAQLSDSSPQLSGGRQSSAVGPQKGLPILPPSTGPSRYQSHTQRSRTFAQLPQSGQSHSHAMEEWMEMDGHDDSAVEEDGSGAKQPSLEELKAAIVALSSDAHTTYLLLTSRTREWCDALFASVPNPPSNLWFAAENGYFFKHGHSRYTADSSEPVWHVMYENVDMSWMEGVHRVMTYFCERTPRSYIQVQETSMQWHYGDAERTFAKRQALDLISHLTGGPLSNTATEVLDSASIVQVRPLAVSKGRALKHLLAYLHKKYRRHSRQQLGGRRQGEAQGSDSEEDPSTAVTASLSVEDDRPSSHQTPSAGLNPAAIQSAMAESGVLLQREREGEQSGYEEDTSSADDEHDDQPAKGRLGRSGAATAAGSANGSGHSASVPARSHPMAGIRSRRPSLADLAEGGEGAADSHTRPSSNSSPHSTLVLPSPTSANVSPASPAAAATASAQSVPIDFVLCIGNFLERDEDIFPLLNEWADTGSLPAGLSSSFNSSHSQQSQHSTPSSMHSRRLSTQLPQLGGTGGLAGASHTASATSLSSAVAGMASPQSTQSLSDMLSPAGSSMGSPTAADFGASASQPLAAPAPLSIYTVTVGDRLSKARYSVPDLASVNALIIQLAHPTHSPTASPPSRGAVLGGSYELKGMGDITLPATAQQHTTGSTFDSDKEVDERQSGRAAGKAGQEQSAH